MEASSTKPVSRFRETIQVHKRVSLVISVISKSKLLVCAEVSIYCWFHLEHEYQSAVSCSLLNLERQKGS